MYKWREALASCAIEGNQYAIEMLELLKKDPDKFWIEIYKLQQRAKDAEDEGIPSTHHKKRPKKQPK